jgi:hypothetical protein
MPQQKKAARNPLGRKIHLPTGTWSYQIGKSGVNIRTPDLTNTQYVEYTKLFGMTWDETNELEERCSFRVKPHHVRHWIEKHWGN